MMALTHIMLLEKIIDYFILPLSIKPFTPYTIRSPTPLEIFKNKTSIEILNK